MAQRKNIRKVEQNILMKATIVTTTIFVPTFLTGYAENAKRFGHDVNFIVIGDKKTPAETAEFCQTVPSCQYLDLENQLVYMSPFLSLYSHIPVNSVERRNIGMLLAYEQDAETIITLDDDNFATSQDIISWHNVSDQDVLDTYGSSTGWFNVCSLLQEKNGVEFYHRGYPSKQRWNDGFITSEGAVNRVAVNAGLWLDNPDTDAITRLERELVVTGYKNPDFRGKIALAPGTWSPFNCQNTALRRDVVPAYFMSPYTGRHADILASFVVNRLTEHFGEVITFGNPLARHKRTPHDLWKDATLEINGQRLADDFCDRLRSIKLTAKTYHEGYGQIIDALRGMPNGDMDRSMLAGMHMWHHAFTQLEAK